MIICVLLAGNIVYFAQNRETMSECQRKSNKYNQLNSVCFLLILFGYAQGCYYFVIIFSIICMKCHGENPLADADDSDEIVVAGDG